MAKSTGPSKQEQELIEKILTFKYDPEGFVRYVFPWGEKGTPLEKFDGPRSWQLREFRNIREKMLLNREKIKVGLTPSVIYLAVSSGRGPGKSAFLAMLDCWMMSCWIGGTSITTANTETQLRSRTMAEVGKWIMMALNRHWFEKTAMAIRPASWFGNMVEQQLRIDTQYYYAEGQSWSEENPDAFAGAHSQIAMMVKFDEASGVSDSIWNVAEGFFTDLAELRMWVVISNPRRNTGRFFDCFHKDAAYWDHVSIDSRMVEGIDNAVYKRIAEKYGEDHDVTRVEVKGQFPRTGSNQFIGRELVEDAQMRDLEPDSGSALLMGVDVARYGNNDSVIRFRQGRDARSIPAVRFNGLNTMELAEEVAHLIDKYRPDGCFVDGGGVGGGVVDRLKMLGYKVIEVQSGGKPRDGEKYVNKRAELWGELKEWLTFGCIDKTTLLAEDLTGPEYEVIQRGQIKIESKESMKKRGLESTDDADALGLTFSSNIARRDMQTSRRMGRSIRAITDYDIFGT
jgi:hypothetical protein